MKIPGTHGRILSIEGVRGYAVGLIFLVHFLFEYFSHFRGVDLNVFEPSFREPLFDNVAFYFFSSQYGVDLFFALSGFLICGMLMAPGFRYQVFLGNRLTRLYPAFAAAMAAYIAYASAFWHETWDWRTLAANFAFLPGVPEFGYKPIMMPTWSLSYEWIFYLGFPAILLLPAGRSIRPATVAIFASIVLAAAGPINEDYMQFLMFFAGAVIACFPEDWLVSIKRVPDGLALTCYVAATSAYVFNQRFYFFIWIYAPACALLLIKTMYADGWLNRLFSFAPLRWLGRISYSFYLFHGLAIIVAIQQAPGFLEKVPSALHFLVLLAAAMALGIATAWLSYHLLEAPYFSRRQKAEDRKRDATLVQSELAAGANV